VVQDRLPRADFAGPRVRVRSPRCRSVHGRWGQNWGQNGPPVPRRQQRPRLFYPMQGKFCKKRSGNLTMIQHAYCVGQPAIGFALGGPSKHRSAGAYWVVCHLEIT
jgi:hypothetical protein